MTLEVNPGLIASMFGYLVGGEDSDEQWEQYGSLDTNDEPAVRDVMRAEAVPYFERWGPESKRKGKLALSWALTANHRVLERVFDSSLLPFYAPTEYAKFFEWLWDELFPGEDFTLENAEHYKIVDRPEEENAVLIR